jgi:hypothetical protein
MWGKNTLIIIPINKRRLNRSAKICQLYIIFAYVSLLIMQIIDNIYIFGEIKALLVEGNYTDDELNTYGGFGVIHIPGLQEVLKILCEEGFAHHVAASLSQVGDIIHEALTKYMQWTLIYHNKP